MAASPSGHKAPVMSLETCHKLLHLPEHQETRIEIRELQSPHNLQPCPQSLPCPHHPCGYHGHHLPAHTLTWLHQRHTPCTVTTQQPPPLVLTAPTRCPTAIQLSLLLVPSEARATAISSIGTIVPDPNHDHNSHLTINMIGIPPYTMTRSAIFNPLQSEFHPVTMITTAIRAVSRIPAYILFYC